MTKKKMKKKIARLKLKLDHNIGEIKAAEMTNDINHKTFVEMEARVKDLTEKLMKSHKLYQYGQEEIVELKREVVAIEVTADNKSEELRKNFTIINHLEGMIYERG